MKEVNVFAQNKLALAVLELAKLRTFAHGAQGSKKLSGRIEDVSYDVEITHVLGNTYLQGDIGHAKVVMQGREQSGYQLWLLNNFGELDNDGPTIPPLGNANPHNQPQIENLFEMAFERVDDHANRAAVLRKGELKGVAVMREAMLVGIASKLSYLFASKRTSGYNWDLLENKYWAPNMEHLKTTGNIEIIRPSDVVMTIKRANTGSVVIKVHKNVDTQEPSLERKIVMHPFDQLTGDHSTLRQFIREAIDHILEMEKQ